MTDKPIDKHKHIGTGLVVEALQVGPETVDRMANWAQCQIVEEINPITRDTQEALNVKTPDGKKRASRGDYVIGVNGRFYVVGEPGFLASYEPYITTPQPASRADEEYTASPFDDPFKDMTRFNEGPKP